MQINVIFVVVVVVVVVPSAINRLLVEQCFSSLQRLITSFHPILSQLLDKMVLSSQDPSLRI